METQAKPGTTLAERIGSTPLIRLDRMVQAVRGFEGFTLVAKAEWVNPGGSVKEGAAASISQEEASTGRQAVIVTVLPDSAEKCLSECFWEQP
ncbi:MAG TPA: hypothetical protein VMQ56_01850 [Terracidiphilus sp.]|jgi:cysteine synthase|nr:hypothetical protein [Terracidiphilus sp.]